MSARQRQTAAQRWRTPIAIDGEQEEQLVGTLAQAETSEPYYVLLHGSDAREADATSRSDTIILARVDEDAARITMVSIPRDAKVTIPGHGTQKINAAYAFGGAAGAVDAVSAFAGVEISHYVEIHFDELVRIVDDLGASGLTHRYQMTRRISPTRERASRRASSSWSARPP